MVIAAGKMKTVASDRSGGGDGSGGSPGGIDGGASGEGEPGGAEVSVAFAAAARFVGGIVRLPVATVSVAFVPLGGRAPSEGTIPTAGSGHTYIGGPEPKPQTYRASVANSETRR
jgi:hypothetical protein